MSPERMTRLQELRQYHVDAVERLKAYADDAGLRDGDVKHYTKRADIHQAHVETIDDLLAEIERLRVRIEGIASELELDDSCLASDLRAVLA